MVTQHSLHERFVENELHANRTHRDLWRLADSRGELKGKHA